MKIFVGADHNGFPKVQAIVEYLKLAGHEVIDKTDGKLDPMTIFRFLLAEWRPRFLAIPRIADFWFVVAAKVW